MNSICENLIRETQNMQAGIGLFGALICEI